MEPSGPTSAGPVKGRVLFVDSETGQRFYETGGSYDPPAGTWTRGPERRRYPTLALDVESKPPARDATPSEPGSVTPPDRRPPEPPAPAEATTSAAEAMSAPRPVTADRKPARSPAARFLREVIDSSDDPVAIRERIAGAVQSGFVHERDVVFAARDLFDEHNRHGKACWCRDCERLTPIARTLLPEEQRAAKTAVRAD